MFPTQLWEQSQRIRSKKTKKQVTFVGRIVFRLAEVIFDGMALYSLQNP